MSRDKLVLRAMRGKPQTRMDTLQSQVTGLKSDLNSGNSNMDFSGLQK
jgi:hypothetical protein